MNLLYIYYIYSKHESRGDRVNIIIRNEGDTPIYEQIVTQVKSAILAGELAEGEALPSMRLLAKELRISLITTKRAYEELEREGFVVTVPGRGSFVAAANWELLREEHRRRMEEYLAAAAAAARMGGVTRDEMMQVAGLFYDESSPGAGSTEQEETP